MHYTRAILLFGFLNISLRDEELTYAKTPEVHNAVNNGHGSLPTNIFCQGKCLPVKAEFS